MRFRTVLDNLGLILATVMAVTLFRGYWVRDSGNGAGARTSCDPESAVVDQSSWQATGHRPGPQPGPGWSGARQPAFSPGNRGAELGMTRDPKIRLSISRMLQLDRAFRDANPGLVPTDVTSGRVGYKDIQLPSGTELLAAMSPSCQLAQPVPGQKLAFEPYDVKVDETVQDLMDEAQRDPCILNIFNRSAGGGGNALVDSGRGTEDSAGQTPVAAVVPLDDHVKALAKADILQKARESGTDPTLIVASVTPSGDSSGSATEKSRQMMVRDPLTQGPSGNPATTLITVTHEQIPVTATQGPAQATQVGAAIQNAVNSGARLIAIPEIDPHSIQTSLDYAASHGAQVVTIPGPGHG